MDVLSIGLKLDLMVCGKRDSALLSGFSGVRVLSESQICCILRGNTDVIFRLHSLTADSCNSH